MAITGGINKGELEKEKKKLLAVVRRWQIKFLQRLGEVCITHARDLPPSVGYNDQTGAARSSTGYTIFEDSTAIRENFKAVRGNEEGIKAGKKLAREVAESGRYRGIYIVFVAGMHYTVYLEAKGRDVLTSAEILALREAPKLLEEINKAIKQA